MSQSRPRRSRDPNKRAFEVCQEATGGPPPSQETVEETLESMSAAMHGDASMRSRAVQVLTGIIKSEHDAARKIDKNLEWRIRRRDEHQHQKLCIAEDAEAADACSTEHEEDEIDDADREHR